MSTVFLTAIDVAHILRISKALAYRLIAQGEIPSFQFGRVSRVRQEDLDAFIQQHMRKPNSNATTGNDNNTGLPEKGDIQQGV